MNDDIMPPIFEDEKDESWYDCSCGWSGECPMEQDCDLFDKYGDDDDGIFICPECGNILL